VSPDARSEEVSLTLYIDAFSISPYALSAFVALEEKELPYELVEVPLHEKAQLRTAYGARTNRVPSLRHDELWLSESIAIAEYLAETFPFPDHPRLFPADLKERAICREVMSWVRSDLMSIREERGTHTVFYDEPVQPLGDVARRDVARLVRFAEALVHGPTLFASWCIADVDLAMMLMRLRNDGLPKALLEYAHANWQRPSVKKWCERRRSPYVPY
jgi:glutathione S-transferase